MAFFVVLSAPRLYRSFRTGRIWESVGFWEKAGGYRPIQEESHTEKAPDPPSTFSKHIGALRALVHGATLFSIPKTQLDLGESMDYHCCLSVSKDSMEFRTFLVILIAIYYGILITCLLVQARLDVNSNRAGSWFPSLRYKLNPHTRLLHRFPCSSPITGRLFVRSEEWPSSSASGQRL